jgi:N-acetylglucosamine-6-phosphate deacetylase
MELANGQIVMLTVAPELEGCEALVRHAVSNNVVVSLGHHMADGPSIDRAVRAGASCCTHLGNGIPGTLPRHPNPLWSQLAEPKLAALLITDGHHLPPEFVRVVCRIKGVDNIVVTSDAAAIAGLPPGEYEFAGINVISESNGRISVKGENTLAGSSATMEDCLTWLRSLDFLSTQELTQVGRLNPLRILGIR